MEPASPSPRLAADPIRHRAAFTFSACFPPGDLVGHFVIGLAAVMNDLQLLNSFLMPLDDPSRDDLTKSERSSVLRRLLGTIWEMHLFVKDALSDEQVTRFLDRIEIAYPDDVYSGPELVAFLRGDAGATAPAMREILRAARNSTFHYPKIRDPEFHAALEILRDNQGELIGGERMSSLRATFAEEVMLAIALRDVDGDDQAAVERFGTSIAPVVIAVVHLAQIALNEWLGDHDVTFEEIDPGTAGEY